MFIKIKETGRVVEVNDATASDMVAGGYATVTGALDDDEPLRKLGRTLIGHEDRQSRL